MEESQARFEENTSEHDLRVRLLEKEVLDLKTAQNPLTNHSNEILVAKVAKSLTSAEQKPPKFEDFTTKGYAEWRKLFNLYVDEEGSKSPLELMTPDAKILCADLLGVRTSELLQVSSSLLLAQLDKEFRLKDIDPEAVFTKLRMQLCSDTQYNRHKLETYRNSFVTTIALEERLADTDLGGGTQLQLCNWFIGGLQPLIVQRNVLKKGAVTLSQAMKALRDVLERMDSLEWMQSSCELAKPCEIQKKQKILPQVTLDKRKRSCTNCLEAGHNSFDCPKKECLDCLRKYKTKHPRWDKTCPLYQAWLTKKQVENPGYVHVPRVKQVSVQSTVVPITAVASGLDFAGIIQALQTQMQSLQAAVDQKVRLRKATKCIDSGATGSIIAVREHADNPHLPYPFRSSVYTNVETANGGGMQIAGEALMEGLGSQVCPDAVDSLVSVVQLTGEKDCVVVFDKDSCVALKLDDMSSQLYKQLINLSIDSNNVL